MYGKISKLVIGLLSFLLALSFSVEASYKSSHSKPSSSISTSSSKTNSSSSLTRSSVKHEPSVADNPVAKKSISGAKLVEQKGKIATNGNAAAFSARDTSPQKNTINTGRSTSYLGTKAPPEKVFQVGLRLPSESASNVL